MENLIKLGRIVYAICIAGLGLQQFYFPGFRPVLVPGWPEWMPDPQWLVYLMSVGLIISSLSIVFNFKARESSLVLGIFFLLLFVVCHVPFQVANNITSLGGWTNPLKVLALSGGAFVVADTFPSAMTHNLFRSLERMIKVGHIFVGIMFFIFGIDHFLYYQFVQTLVPLWIPSPLFWTYFAGIALIGSGVSFMLKIKLRIVGILTAIMLFLWVVILHIPRAISMFEVANGNELTSVFQALAFSGVALVVAYAPAVRTVAARAKVANEIPL